MGNEKSALNGMDIEEKSVEITDFWIHNTAKVNNYNSRKVSVFISEPFLHYGASFGKPSPLERAAKNLMLHRHPCVLRYILSWSKGSKFFLTTEQVRPLIQLIETQNTLQICRGLCSILRALVFLHETASASHNNVCGSAIYITPEGCWKLSGLEYLCKFKDLTPTYLQKIRNYRYDRAISPEEDNIIASGNFTAIDAYAFGVLAEDILKLKNSEDVPGLLEFKEFCKENLQNADPSLRSKLSGILKHPFFTHDFMRIHAFLEELPLKNDMEKKAFFENLVTQLRAFPETVVAEQLGRLLLSRIVLLNTTAQNKLLPFVLKARDNKEETDDIESSLFTTPTFKTYLVPQLLEMFCIRDASIRLVLLSHFTSFVSTFELEELKNQVLPELLVGIKDTNDLLVCATLRALADIVPILGAATVIGGNRGKLFTDGRPNKINQRKEANFTNITNEFAPVILSSSENKVELPERPSPDGGEDKTEAGCTFPEEECTWSDWDNQDSNVTHDTSDPQRSDQQSLKIDQENQSDVEFSLPEKPNDSSIDPNINKTVESNYIKKPIALSDISQLDIKHSKSIDSSREEFDFFTDMEPVIKKTQVLHVQETSTQSKFDVKMLNDFDESVENNGWDEDFSDWGTHDTQQLKF